jgi:hypothetical protein
MITWKSCRSVDSPSFIRTSPYNSSIATITSLADLKHFQWMSLPANLQIYWQVLFAKCWTFEITPTSRTILFRRILSNSSVCRSPNNMWRLMCDMWRLINCLCFSFGFNFWLLMHVENVFVERVLTCWSNVKLTSLFDQKFDDIFRLDFTWFVTQNT